MFILKLFFYLKPLIIKNNKQLKKSYPKTFFFEMGEIGTFSKKIPSIGIIELPNGFIINLYPLFSHSRFDRFIGYIIFDNETLLKVYKSKIPWFLSKALKWYEYPNIFKGLK